METDFFTTPEMVIACTVYAIAAVFMEAYSAIPPRDWLTERIGHLRASTQLPPAIDSLLAKTAARLNIKFVGGLQGSKVQAGWRLLHDVEDALAAQGSTSEVQAQLNALHDRLAAMKGAGAKSLVKRIEVVLKDDRVTADDRALVEEAWEFVHNLNDSGYESLAQHLTKAMFLTFMCLAAIVVLSATQHRELYFLLGAAGGLLSRAMRVLKKVNTADYGASWAPLILSPAVGALAAWIGIAIVTALATSPLDVLNDDLPDLIWVRGDAPIGLVLAFLFGFSERLFASVVETGEARILPLVTEAPKTGE